MSDNLSNKVALVIDNGLFVSFAQMLSREFGRVLYWTPWWDAFPNSNDRLVGYGLSGIERVNELFDVLPKADIVVALDVYMGDFQAYLEDNGKRVWGPRYGEELELNRWGLKKLLKKAGLPVPESEQIIGIDDLRKYMKSHEDFWIKVSAVRGDFETHHCIRYELSEPWLDHLEHKLGAKKYIEEFIVEETISPAIETGYDGFTVDGQYPITGITGFEIKDYGYIAVTKYYQDLPKQVKLVNETLSDALAKYHYRGNFSTEIRCTPDGKAYLIDPCTRLGSPPNELYQELWSNWGEIIWKGADGELVEPKSVAKYAVEALIHSSWADSEWSPLYFPEDVRPWIKLRNHCIINEKDYVVPQKVGLPEIGAVVGIGDTLIDAIKACKEHADKIEGYELDVKLSAIDQALGEIEKAAEIGIQFTDDPLPSKEEVREIISSDGKYE